MLLKDYITELLKTFPKGSSVSLEICVEIYHSEDRKEKFIVVDSFGSSNNRIKLNYTIE